MAHSEGTLPKQAQEHQPGHASAMQPRPQSSMRAWAESGKLSGRVASITGGGFDIATLAAIAFAKEGADLLLASDGASYMTGQLLHPNGGEIVNA